MSHIHQIDRSDRATLQNLDHSQNTLLLLAGSEFVAEILIQELMPNPITTRELMHFAYLLIDAIDSEEVM